MRIMMYLGGGLLTMIAFIVLALFSQFGHWPLWVSALGFIGLFILATAGMTYLTVQIKAAERAANEQGASDADE